MVVFAIFGVGTNWRLLFLTYLGRHSSHQRDYQNIVKIITTIVDILIITCHPPLSLTTIMFLDLPIQTLSASVRKMVSFVREIVMKYLVCFEGVIFATFSLFKMLSERLNLNCKWLDKGHGLV